MQNVNLRPIVLSASFLLLAALAPAAAPTMAEHVRVPAGGIQPQAQVDDRGRVHLIFFNGDPKRGDVFYAHSDDWAKTFSEPIRVNSQPGSVVAAGIIRGPQLAVGKGGRAHVTWMGSDKAEPKVDGEHVPMLYARLNDAGDAFDRQRNLIQRRPGLDGGGSVAADTEGNVYVAWHAPKDKLHEGHAEADRRVWLARSSDEGRTFAEEVEASPEPTGACGCCGMKLFAADGGTVLALYRSATQAVNRDIYLLGSTDRGGTFSSAKVGPWRASQCVMSTAAFAQRADGPILAAWEQERQVLVSTIHPVTLQAGKAQVIRGAGEKSQKHPTLAFNASGRGIVAWAERGRMNQPGEVVWQLIERDGTPVVHGSGRKDGLPGWSAPAVFAKPDGTFVMLY